MKNLFMTEKKSLKAQRRELIMKAQSGSNSVELMKSFCKYYEDFCCLRGLSPYDKYEKAWNKMQECIIISLECCDVWEYFTDGTDMGMFLIDIYGVALGVIDKYSFEYMENRKAREAAAI